MHNVKNAVKDKGVQNEKRHSPEWNQGLASADAAIHVVLPTNIKTSCEWPFYHLRLNNKLLLFLLALSLVYTWHCFCCQRTERNDRVKERKRQLSLAAQFSVTNDLFSSWTIMAGWSAYICSANTGLNLKPFLSHGQSALQTLQWTYVMRHDTLLKKKKKFNINNNKSKNVKIYNILATLHTCIHLHLLVSRLI